MLVKPIFRICGRIRKHVFGGVAGVLSYRSGRALVNESISLLHQQPIATLFPPIIEAGKGLHRRCAGKKKQPSADLEDPLERQLVAGIFSRTLENWTEGYRPVVVWCINPLWKTTAASIENADSQRYPLVWVCKASTMRVRSVTGIPLSNMGMPLFSAERV